MIVINLSQRVADIAGLKALEQPTLTDQQIVWNLAEAMAYMYFANAEEGIAPDDQVGGKGFWVKDPSIIGLDLQQFKNYRYQQVDEKTGSLIGAGFSFDGRTFSMSLNAQINWSNFPNLPDGLFPLNIMDITENVYVLALANKINFYLSALNYKNAQLQSGSILKGQIKACADDACVNAIIDNR